MTAQFNKTAAIGAAIAWSFALAGGVLLTRMYSPDLRVTQQVQAIETGNRVVSSVPQGTPPAIDYKTAKPRPLPQASIEDPYAGYRPGRTLNFDPGYSPGSSGGANPR